MCQRSLKTFWTVALLLCLIPSPGRAQYEYLDINKPSLRKLPMAIPYFAGLAGEPAESPLLKTATDMLTDMLLFTEYFNLLDRGAYLIDPANPPVTEDRINFANWKSIGAELLITGAMAFKDNMVDIELRMFDTLAAKRLIGKRYHGTEGDLRQIMRRFCSEVIFQLTGNRGFFDSYIAFVSTGTGHKEIYICEFDGQNVKQFTYHQKISFFPSWSSDAKWLAYTTYVKDKPEIYVREVNGSRQSIIDHKGLNLAPAWAPDRFELAATLSFSGNQEIYLLTGTGKIIKRITNNWASDLSPTWSPDGKKIAFVSNRSGSPQIFIKEIDSGVVERLTFEGSYNTQPSWSPLGNRIAYTSSGNVGSDIFVIDLDRRELLQMTGDSGYNESPSWSPDGSLIAFSTTREGPSRIYVMTAYGTDQQRLLSLPGQQSNPKWSSNESNH
jgi:TolB protein